MSKFKFSIKLLYDIVTNFFTSCDLVLISESSNWVINEECKNIQQHLQKFTNIRAKISVTPSGLRNKVIHFLSENTLIDKNGIRKKFIIYKIHPSNKTILSWFHISNEDKYRIKHIPLLNDFVDFVHTSSSNTKKKLIKNGLLAEKIIVVPLGIDTSIFTPVNKEEKIELRKKLSLPANDIIIGSFQKDGNGWKDGLTPKLIKGPDIFCDAVEKLSKKFKIHVLLTGPARGYVEKRLKDAGISYTHKYFDKYFDIIPYMQSLDLYLVCSREEGGPKAILETMATGIPLVTTNVGMASDIIEDGKDGCIARIEDTDQIVNKASFLLENSDAKDLIIKNALIKIKDYDLKIVENKLYLVYNELISIGTKASKQKNSIDDEK